eukprot:jgi/Botrbrau1/4784/Bobra.0325s0007.1
MMVNDGQPVRMSDVVNGFAAGAISSLLSRSLTYPLDTIKSQLQMESAADHSSPRAALRLVRQVAASEGVPGFYRGFGAVLVGSIPGSMAYFGAFEMAKVLLPADSGLAGGLATGAFAQLLGGLVFTPMDIIKERLQAQRQMRGLYTYRGSWDAFKDAWARGGLPSLFRGYWLTNSVWLPWSMLYAAVYGEAKKAAALRLGCEEAQLPAVAIVAASAGSAGFAGLLTHPLDVVKTRLQVLSAVTGQGHISAGSVVEDLYRSAGLRAFAAGLGTRSLHLACSTALSWVLYEEAKQYLM